MKASQKCIDLIKQFEGFFDKAYYCPAHVETIGFGTIRYKNGNKVKIGDTITMKEAEDELMFEVSKCEKYLVGLNINQNQVDACLSFMYNLGANNFLYSTLYKKIKANPNDLSIADEFMRWNKARVNGKLVELKGLTRRRKAESDLYFSIV